MFPVKVLDAYRRRIVHFVLLFMCVALIQNAHAFESSISSTFNPFLAMSASSFKNVLTQSGSFSTATEFKSVECKHITNTIGNIDVGTLLEVSVVKLQEVLALTKQLDDIQYQLCTSMLPSGKSAELTIKLGSAWQTTLRTGDTLQRDFSAILQNEDHIQELIDRYTNETKKLQEIVNSTGSEK